MKTLITTTLLLIFFTPFADQSSAWAQRAGKGQKSNSVQRQQQQGQRKLTAEKGKTQSQTVASTGSRAANVQELLTDMRQEEKLARDVYQTLQQKWQDPIFGRIASAEQKHMIMIGNLLEKYNITDPITDDRTGVFPSERFALLYQTLVQQGSESLTAAIKVGIKIEEMDIADLRRTKTAVQQKDILRVLNNLERASGNHLRAFVSRLNALGGQYQPEFLTKDSFVSILNNQSSNGNGFGQAGKMQNGQIQNGQNANNQGSTSSTGNRSNGKRRGKRSGGR